MQSTGLLKICLVVALPRFLPLTETFRGMTYFCEQGIT